MAACPCFLETLMSRRSIRRFRPDPIPRELVERIVEAGIRAPTAGGGEQWFFVAVLDEARRRRIHELLIQAHMRYAQEVLRTPLPRDRVERWLRMMRRGEYLAPLYIAAYLDLRRRLYRDEYLELERLWAIQSLAAAIENMLLAAHGLGLGGVWLGVPLLMRREFDEVLQPPEGCELQGILAIGYPAEEPGPRPRRPLHEVLRTI